MYDCPKGTNPADVWMAIRGVVFRSPTLEITDDGQRLELVDDDMSLTFRTVVGAAVFTFGQHASWKAVSMDDDAIVDGPTISRSGEIEGCALGGSFHFSIEADGFGPVLRLGALIDDYASSVAEADEDLVYRVAFVSLGDPDVRR